MNAINNRSRTLKMSMEGGIGLMRRGALMCVQMYRVWKHRKTATDRGTSVFAFLHHLNFMYTRSAVLSKYQDFHTVKTGCQAARPRLIIQQFSPIFVISCMHTFAHSVFDPMTGYNKASFLLSKMKKKTNTHGHFSLLLVTRRHAAVQRK